MRTILLGAVLALAAAGGCSNDKSSSSSATAEKADDVPTVTLDETEKLLAANEATAIDCNGDRTRKKYGILPGAVLIADEESFPASDLPADKARKLIFYCSDTR